MDAEKLRSLQISQEAKTRSQGPLWVIFLGVVLLAGIVAYCARPSAEGDGRVFRGRSREASPSSIALSPTSNVALHSTPALAQARDSVLTVSGYIVNRERIEISPRFLGLVKWIGVHKGDPVTNGQVLVLLDDAEQKAHLKEAEGRLANARAALAKAELDYQRIASLIADHIETRQAEDDARNHVDSARASVQEAEGTLELNRTYLEWTIIRSTLNGVVLERLVDAGELVTPQSFGGTRGPSTALLAIADPKDLQVEIELNEADLAKVYRGQKCAVAPEAYPEKTYEGYVAEIAPEANRQKGTLQVKVQIRNPDEFLTPELTAKVDFLRGESKVQSPESKVQSPRSVVSSQ
jgi:HlyD family secretion protein